jgi:RNA polymerase sigma factor (sigma-70 family)
VNGDENIPALATAVKGFSRTRGAAALGFFRSPRGGPEFRRFLAWHVCCPSRGAVPRGTRDRRQEMNMSARTRTAASAARAVAARDRLAVTYRPYVLKLARDVAEAMAFHVEIDDLIGWGHMGLIEAAARYDPRRGVTFRTFAHRRIKGAMLDGIRREATLVTAVSSLEAAGSAALIPAPSAVCADLAYAQDAHVMRHEIRVVLDRAMETLTPLERAIVHHHYYDGEPVQMLVGSTRFSKSWLSRVHARALAKLRDCLLARARGHEAYL